MLPPRLLALTLGDLCERGPRAVTADAKEAVGGGLRGILVREPHSEDGELLVLLQALLALRSEAHDLWIGVHDRAHLARVLPLNGLHLGFRSLLPKEARTALGPRSTALAVGLSTHAADLEAKSFPEEGTDYIFHGPVHPTPSKGALPEHPSPIGCVGIESALRRTRTPLWALGGLSAEDVPEVLGLEVDGVRPAGVCVQSGILGQADPRQAATTYLAALQEVHPA